jgi:hypothetical protein
VLTGVQMKKYIYQLIILNGKSLCFHDLFFVTKCARNKQLVFVGQIRIKLLKRNFKLLLISGQKTDDLTI